MKWTEIILLTLFCTFSTTAPAVDLCVKINTNNCTTMHSGSNTEITVTCDHDVEYSVLSICADSAGSSNGESDIDIEQSHIKDGGVNCWCKIIFPIYTPWIFYFPSTDKSHYDNATDCEQNCSTLCYNKISNLTSHAQ